MTNTPLILLVEDNPDDEALTIRAFRKSNANYKITVAHDGVEALDYLFGDNPIPDLILLDIKLPRVDGLEVLQRLRANPKTEIIPTVILTSSKEQEDLINGYSLGANSYIRKPVNFEQFTKVIQEIGLYWLVINQVPDREG